MKSRSFDDLYNKEPRIYETFHNIVRHADNYFHLLNNRKLFSGVKTALNIGAGFGELEAKLLKKHPELRFGCNEMSSAYVKAYRDRLESEQLSSRILEIQQCPFQEYRVGLKYDLTVSVHSWYAFGCNIEMLEKALATLNSDGRLFVSVVGANNFTIKLVSVVGAPHVPFHSQHLHNWLENLKVQHEYHEWNHEIAFDSILKNGEFTPQGKGFLAFHSRTPWAEIPARNVEDAKTFLLSVEKEGRLRLENGYVLINSSERTKL